MISRLFQDFFVDQKGLQLRSTATISCIKHLEQCMQTVSTPKSWDRIIFMPKYKAHTVRKPKTRDTSKSETKETAVFQMRKKIEGASGLLKTER